MLDRERDVVDGRRRSVALRQTPQFDRRHRFLPKGPSPRRIVRSLGLGAEGVLDAALPQPLPATLYARIGDGPAGLILLAALALVLVASWIDTWRSLRRREIMGDWLARVRRRSQSESR